MGKARGNGIQIRVRFTTAWLGDHTHSVTLETEREEVYMGVCVGELDVVLTGAGEIRFLIVHKTRRRKGKVTGSCDERMKQSLSDPETEWNRGIK